MVLNSLFDHLMKMAKVIIIVLDPELTCCILIKIAKEDIVKLSNMYLV